MPVRTAELGTARLTAVGVPVTIATVPTGETWIIKQYDVHLLTGDTILVLYRVERGGLKYAFFASATTTTPAHVGAIQRFFVAEPGDLLDAVIANGNGAMDVRIWLSGSKLSGVAP